MRLFFLMLLLLNGAFFSVNALREPTDADAKITIDTSTPQLVLLTELDKPQASTKITSDESTSEPNQATADDSSLDLNAWLAKFTDETTLNPKENTLTIEDDTTQEMASQCFTAGPFQNSDTLQQATLFFNDINIPFQQRSIIENHYIGLLVYLPSFESRKEVVATAEILANKGVKDYMLLNEAGKRHSLSLGVYGLKKNAEQRIKSLAKLNYQAQSEARYRKKTIYWLDYALTDAENQSQASAQQMNNLNVSQIQRNCKS